MEAFRAQAVNVVQIERRRIWIGDSDTNKMDGLIPVTRPIREDRPRSRYEAMEVDPMDRQEAEEGDIEDNGGECAALQANGPGGTCYYCTRDGLVLQNCLRKAARLPHSAPLAAERRGGNEKGREFINKCLRY